MRLINEDRFKGIKEDLNKIGEQSKEIRDKPDSAVGEALVCDVLYGKNPDVKPLFDYLSGFNSDSPD
ncbi:MAG: hypothetical protein ISQ13_02800 [Candidatus Margulisbacteria bacterium]|nr:hypothetical protein [Candidatus Margulisiibacteriota bacterium]